MLIDREYVECGGGHRLWSQHTSPTIFFWVAQFLPLSNGKGTLLFLKGLPGITVMVAQSLHKRVGLLR